jgi:hypothetical protein
MDSQSNTQIVLVLEKRPNLSRSFNNFLKITLNTAVLALFGETKHSSHRDCVQLWNSRFMPFLSIATKTT